MRRRVFNFLTLCSTAIFCALVLCSFLIRDAHCSFEVCPGLCVGLTSWYGAPRVEIFNEAKFGRYRGGIIEIVAAGQPGRVQSRGFNFLDIYFRHLRWPDGTAVWTMSFGLIDLALLGLAMPTMWLIRRAHRDK